MMHDFSDQTVIVTGAGRGIGEAVSHRFAQAGASVWMVDRDADVVGAAAERIGPAAVAAVADVSRTEDVARVVAEAVAQTGRIDVLFNNAGLLRDKTLWNLTDEDWDAVLAVHLGGAFRFTRACVPHFRERRYGRVVNVTSYTGLHGNVGQAAYAAAKELARFGVTVNAIAPIAQTRMIDSIPDEHRDPFQALIPLGRFADPEEIAAGVLFLASRDAGYVTGAVLPIDGGMAM